MNTLIHILLNNVIPLGMLISVGFTLHKVFHLDIRTLSKLNFYLFAPAVIFVMLVESNLSSAVFFQVVLFFASFFVALFLLTEIVVRLRGYSPGMRGAMKNSVLFYNSANYAIPLNQLAFSSNPFALSIQIIIAMFQSLIPMTYGVYSVNAHQLKWKDIAKTILALPVIYAIPAALLVRWSGYTLPSPISIPLHYVADGFIATALATLGVQLASMKWEFHFSDVLLSNFLRLLISPLLGFLIVLLLGIDDPLTAKSLVLSCAVPTSLSSVLLAVEYKNEADFASQTVFSSTVFSIFTVAVVIFVLELLY